MKIVHVLYSGLGGHGNVFFSMVKADINKEMEYEAIFYGIEDIREEYIKKCAENNIKYFFVKKKPGLDICYYLMIIKYIKKTNSDIVFLHGSAYIFITKIVIFFLRQNCKIVIRETQANHLKSKVQWLTLTLAMLLADKVVCLTKEFNNQVKKKVRFFYRKDKIIVISNGIDLDAFKPKDKKQAVTEFTIGMQSRIIGIKDHITLLKSFAITKKHADFSGKILKLIIAGDGEMKEELIKLSEELTIKNDVIFTGILAEKELIDFLQKLDLYIHASLGETMSTSVMQAMSCKLPIIASDVAGINNMITTSITGILVPAKNELAMSKAIIDCIKNPVMRQTLAENAYQYAINNFSNQTMFDTYKRKVFMPMH